MGCDALAFYLGKNEYFVIILVCIGHNIHLWALIACIIDDLLLYFTMSIFYFFSSPFFLAGFHALNNPIVAVGIGFFFPYSTYSRTICLLS
jgi:hypothetical protein